MDAAQMPGVCVFTIQVALPSGICPWKCSPDGGLAEPLKIQCCLVLCFINIVPSDICAKCEAYQNQNQNQRNHGVVGSGAPVVNERPGKEAIQHTGAPCARARRALRTCQYFLPPDTRLLVLPLLLSILLSYI